MGRFSVISENAFNEFQAEVGVLLKNFNPESPTLDDAEIICATTGGITHTCSAEYRDNGEDVDNCPNGMMELMEVTNWTATIAFNALNVTPEVIRMALGAADVDAEKGKIIPRRDLKNTDFADVWWVGDRTDGGLVAIRLINALSTSGLSLQTTKNGKGQISVTLSGHVSIQNQTLVPMEFYVQEGTEE